LLNSDYPESSKFYSKKNKKVIDKFKDEAAGKSIVKFIGLKSKMYSYKKEEYEKVKLQITIFLNMKWLKPKIMKSLLKNM